MNISPKLTSITNLDHKIFTQLKIVGVKIFKVALNNDTIELFARSKKRVAQCPSCGNNSRAVRSRYLRRLMDLPVGVMKVKLHLLARKFKCNNLQCQQLIFCEQYPELTTKYSRKTSRVADLLTKILIELSSVKGSYITNLLNIRHSSSSCLRIVHNLSIPPPEVPECIGVDDWAKRKGMSYGTIIVNSQTGKAIELIDSRESDDIIDTLSTFKGVSFVTRDRARGYAKALSLALPLSKQIADKFHLSKNLSDAIHEHVKSQYKQIRQNYLDNNKWNA